MTKIRYQIIQLIFYFFFFGAFYADLAGFLGAIGFSIALNGGVARRVNVPGDASTAVAGKEEGSPAEGSLVYGAAT